MSHTRISECSIYCYQKMNSLLYKLVNITVIHLLYFVFILSIQINI
jgi:hypothetical protein